MPHSKIAFRKASLEDAPELALIGAATLLESFAGLLPGRALVAQCLRRHTPEVYADLLAQPTTHAWLVEVSGGADRSPAPVGYLVLSAPDFPAQLVEPGDLELKRIYLFSRFHGGGTGQSMMDRAIAHARHLGARRLLLGVHPDNRRALAFYHRNGFREIGRRTFQLGDSLSDDPVLALELEP